MLALGSSQSDIRGRRLASQAVARDYFVANIPFRKTYLVLDEELDTLNGGGSGLRDGGGNTTHCRMLLALHLGILENFPGSYRDRLRTPMPPMRAWPIAMDAAEPRQEGNTYSGSRQRSRACP